MSSRLDGVKFVFGTNNTYGGLFLASPEFWDANV